MKTTGTRSLVLLALLAAFLFGLVWFTGEFALDGGSWAMQAYNGHLKGGGQLSYAGQVLDRNGVVLAQSVDGQRQYPPDEATRRACLHVVGDSDGAISTGVQSLYRAELAGYNLFTGLAAPDGSSLGNDVRLRGTATMALAWAAPLTAPPSGVVTMGVQGQRLPRR